MDGPVHRTETIAEVPTATAKALTFSGIPPGVYTVTATHGGKTITKNIEVKGATLDVQMAFR